MKKNVHRLFAVALAALLLSTFVFAQNDRSASTAAQDYVISAKAGGVNLVEGNVTVKRADGKSGYLIRNDKLEIGDVVTTGNNARAEILLNPGSYIRLGANSEFEFVTTSLDDLKLKLSTGSAMLEVFADNKFMVEVIAQNTKFYLIESGVYRIDAISTIARIEVWEGQAQVGDANPTIVKEGRVASVNGSEVTVAKFDDDEKDALESWSKQRGKELAKATSRLERNALRSTLMNGIQSNAWNVWTSFGLWIYDASLSRPGYCFLPFGRGWRSPYGYYYGWDLWNIRLPGYNYNQPPGWVYQGNNGNGNGNSNGNGNGSVSTVNGPVTIRDNTPPFQQMQTSDSSGVTTRKSESQVYDPSSSSNSSSEPIRVMPAPVPPPSPSSSSSDTKKP